MAHCPTFWPAPSLPRRWCWSATTQRAWRCATRWVLNRLEAARCHSFARKEWLRIHATGASHLGDASTQICCTPLSAGVQAEPVGHTVADRRPRCSQAPGGQDGGTSGWRPSPAVAPAVVGCVALPVTLQQRPSPGRVKPLVCPCVPSSAHAALLHRPPLHFSRLPSTPFHLPSPPHPPPSRPWWTPSTRQSTPPSCCCCPPKQVGRGRRQPVAAGRARG